MGYDPLGLDTPVEANTSSYDPLRLGKVAPESSLTGSLKTGLKESVASPAGFYEKLLPAPLDYPLRKVREYFTPSKEELEAADKSGILGQVVRGAANLPGAAVKYGPAMALGTAALGPLAGPAAGMGAVEAIAAPEGERLKRGLMGAGTGLVLGALGPAGKPIKDVAGKTIGEEVVRQGLSRAAKIPILAGTFGGQELEENLSQGRPLGESLERSIPATILGAGFGALHGKYPLPKGRYLGEGRTPIGGEFEPYRPPAFSPYEAPPFSPWPEDPASRVARYPLVPVNGPRRPLGLPGSEPPLQLERLGGLRALPPGRTTEGESFTMQGPSPGGPPILRPGEMTPPSGREVRISPEGYSYSPESLAALRRRQTEFPRAGGTPGAENPPPLAPAPSPTPGAIQLAYQGPFRNEISELRDMVNEAQAGGLIFSESKVGEGGGSEVRGVGSSFPPFLQKLTKKGYSKASVLKAIDKGLRGEDLEGPRGGQKSVKIWNEVLKEAEALNKGRVEEEAAYREQTAAKDEAHRAIIESDPEFLKEETKTSLTGSFDDEIMGLKEEWREKGYSTAEIDSAISEAYKIAEAKGLLESPAEIAKELSPEPAAPEPSAVSPEIQKIQQDLGIKELNQPLEDRVAQPERAGLTEDAQKLRESAGAPSPTRKGETLLPGMKVGLEQPSTAKEGKTPTLEGTPLAEAARKAETEKRIKPTNRRQDKAGVQGILEPVKGEKGKGTPTVKPQEPVGGKNIEQMSVEEFKKYLHDQAYETIMEPTAPGSPHKPVQYLRLKIGDEVTFFRKGNLPEGGKSFNHSEGRYESGVSVYPTPEATSLAGLSEGDWYYGKGKIVDIGSDSEPIIIPSGKWEKIGKNESSALRNYHDFSGPKKVTREEALAEPGKPNLEALRKELGDDEFMRQAGAMKFGDKGFEMARDMAEEGARSTPQKSSFPPGRSLMALKLKDGRVIDAEDYPGGEGHLGVKEAAMKAGVPEDQIAESGYQVVGKDGAKQFFTDAGEAAKFSAGQGKTEVNAENLYEINMKERKERFDRAAGERTAALAKFEEGQTAQTFRQFIESKGVKWNKGRPENGEALKAEFDKQQAQFSAGERPGIGLSREEAQSHADEYLKDLPDAPPVRVVASADEVPETLKAQLATNLRNGIRGVYDPNWGRIILVGENLGSKTDVIRTIEHEAVGHYATEALLGKDAQKFFNQVWVKYGKEGLADIAKQRGYDLDTWDGRISAAKEKIAQMAETNEDPGFLKRFYAWIRDMVRDLSGGKVFSQLSDGEIQRVISNAREAMTSGKLREAEMEASRKIEGLRRQVGNIQAVYQAKEPQFSISPKEVGKKFAEEDLIPKAAQFKNGFEETMRALWHAAVPRSGVSRQILDTIMGMKGTRERELAYFVLSKTNERIKSGFERMTNEDNVRFVDNLKSGRPQDTPTLREVDKAVRALDATIGEIYKDKLPPEAWQENHLRVLWKTLPRGSEQLIGQLQEEMAEAKTPEKIQDLQERINWIRTGEEGESEGFRAWLSRRPLEGSKGYFKKHTLADMSEGIKFGGVPVTYNPMEMLETHYADVLKWQTAQDMWKGFGEIGARTLVKPGQRPPEGFVKLNDKIAKVNFAVPAAGEWYVEEGAGRLLNNFLSRDLIRESAAGNLMMGVKNATTAMELSLSPFHFAFETIEAAASQFGLGLRKVWNQSQIQEGLRDMLTAPKAAVDLARLGGAVTRWISDPKEFVKTMRGSDFIRQYPQAAELIGDLFSAGAKLGIHEDYKLKALKTFRENLESKNYIGAALRSIPALNQTLMKPLFENYIPKLKLGLFFKEFSNELVARAGELESGKLTRPELARTVWDFVENRLGEMNFDNLFWDRTFKSSLQLLTRSVTWKLGNIRAFGRAATEQSRELLGAIREGRMPKLTQEMAWAWGVGALTAAIAGVTQYAFTGKEPQEAKDLVYPQIDDQGNRVSLPTYMRDAFSLAHDVRKSGVPIHYVWSSVSGMVGRLFDVLGNKDFYGQKIHDPEDNIITQRIDDLIHMAPLPFSLQSFKKTREQGQPLTRQITGFLGATKAPYWIEKSEAQQLATELSAAKIPGGGMSKEQRKRTDLVKQYAREYQEAQKKGESTDDVMSRLTRDLSAGKLSQVDFQRFRQRAMKESLEFTMGRLTLKEALQVWEKATPEERERIRPLILRKYGTTRLPEERAAALPKIQEIAGEGSLQGIGYSTPKESIFQRLDRL